MGKPNKWETNKRKGNKMKYLMGVALLAFCLSAQAKVIAELVNKGGGKIVITNEACRQAGYKLAYTQMDGAQTLLGCWSMDDSFIHILWYDNDLRSYPLEFWVLKNYKPNT